MQGREAVRQFWLCPSLYWGYCPGYWFLQTWLRSNGRVEAFRGCWHWGNLRHASERERAWRHGWAGGFGVWRRGRLWLGNIGSRGKVSCQLVGLGKVLAEFGRDKMGKD